MANLLEENNKISKIKLDNTARTIIAIPHAEQLC